MFENVIGILKVWMITKALTTPIAWVGLLLLFSVILLFLAMFVKFKNGFVSVASFIVFEVLGVIMLIALFSNSFFRDNLCLKESEIQEFTDVTPKGMVSRKRFRTISVPLLGVSLPDESSIYFSQARDTLLNARFSNKLYVAQSEAYSGVVLYDEKFNNLNELLLREGLASTAKVTPKQYSRIQTKAIRDKKGMWGVSMAPPVCLEESWDILDYSEIWLTFIISMCTSVALMPWLRKVIKIYSL